jgi:hypothetical protein
MERTHARSDEVHGQTAKPVKDRRSIKNLLNLRRSNRVQGPTIPVLGKPLTFLVISPVRT